MLVIAGGIIIAVAALFAIRAILSIFGDIAETTTDVVSGIGSDLNSLPSPWKRDEPIKPESPSRPA